MNYVKALAAELDRHWLGTDAAARTARCSCGGWQFDADRDIVVGERFSPFSLHVAEVLTAHMRTPNHAGPTAKLEMR